MFNTLSASIHGFLAHWQSLRVEGRLPTAADFLDRAHPLFMPHVSILDVDGSDLSVRFLGTGLVARRQRDNTGETWGKDCDELTRRRVAHAGGMVCSHPAGLWQIQQMVTSSGRALEMDAIVLPVTPPAGKCPRIVSFSETRGALGREESTARFHAVVWSEWIDIGFGLPEQPSVWHQALDRTRD